MSLFGVRGYGLISLVELMEQFDPDFLSLLFILSRRGGSFRALERIADQFLVVTPDRHDVATQTIRQLAVHIKNTMKLPPAEGVGDIKKEELLRLADVFERNGFSGCALLLRDENQNPDYSVPECLRELEKEISREMRLLVLMRIPSEKLKYYRGKQQFGAEVEERFPIAGDVEEAGKCLATGRYTASVFHLMRVMEIGVQEFGTRLGVVLSTEKRWQNILDEINKAITALPHATSEEKQAQSNYSGAAAHLFNVKLAWRNQVMHPKDTYTGEEAEDVFIHVRAFMRHLASIL